MSAPDTTIDGFAIAISTIMMKTDLTAERKLEVVAALAKTVRALLDYRGAAEHDVCVIRGLSASIVAAVASQHMTTDEKALHVSGLVGEVTVCGLTVCIDTHVLNLSHRGIRELSADDVAAIARLPWLHTVHLDHNHLSSVPPDLFAHNASLRRVELDFNDLSCVPKELFAHNPALLHVWLSYNELTSLPAELFAHNPALDMLVLSGNPELKRVPIALYRHWSAWSERTRDHCGRQEVADAVAEHPEVLALPLEVPVPTAD